MSICATVGRPVITGFDTCIHDGLVSFTNLKHVDKVFLFYMLSQLESAFKVLGQTGSQANLNTDIVRFRAIALPPPPEQRAIAEALGDADALIASLEKLIAKKHDLKQAAMQELLTGRTRLPGFKAEWEVKELGSVLCYEQPTRYLVRSSEYSDDNDVAVLTANKSFVLGYTDERDGVCETVPVIIFDDFTTASRYVALKILRPRDARDSLRFLSWRMQLIRFSLGDHKRYWISEFQHIRLAVPSPEEQMAIAVVLSDMDAEIGALEARLAKTRDLKQGMMQELLTGRTRLVAGGAA
jgi:type I restriction enzyme S subunit